MSGKHLAMTFAVAIATVVAFEHYKTRAPKGAKFGA